MKLSSVSKAIGSLKHEIKHASPELAAVASRVDSAAKATMRKARGESELERLLRHATSTKTSGCSNSMLQELAQATEYADDCQLILQKVFSRLRPAEDRHQAVMKTLTLVEYLILHGSDLFFKAMRQEQQRVQALMDINWAFEGRTRAGTVRTKATRVIVLLTDRELLDSERVKAWSLQEQIASSASTSSANQQGATSEQQEPISPSFRSESRWDSRRDTGRALAPPPPPPPVACAAKAASAVPLVDLLDLSPGGESRCDEGPPTVTSSSAAEPVKLHDLICLQQCETTIPCA